MAWNTLLVIALFLCSTPAFAQGTQQPDPRTHGSISAGTATTARAPAATQPSNNPFKDPLGQGVPPAVSTNRNQNNSRTSVPIAR
jgi:hypothetical protein